MRLKTDIKPKEATFQVVLDALALTPFYHAFLITANVPAIYMQEFWATISVHRSSIRFNINKKKVSLDVDIFRDIIQFFPKIPRQVFKDLPLEQDILSFIKDLGHTKDITYLIDVNVDYLHQPWRAFATVINKCLSGKETRMDKIRLSHLLFHIEYKDAKKTNKMSYPRFTKIIIDYFMSKDPSISRRNKMFWHTARDDTMFTSMRCISGHEDTQTYYAFASEEKALKPKYIRKKADSDTSPKKKPVQATKGQNKSSDEDDDDEVSVSKNDDENVDNEDDDDQDNDNEQTKSNNDGDDFVHPKFSTHDEKVRKDEVDKEEECSDLRVHTPSHFESTDDEAYDEVTQGDNVEEEKLDEEKTNEEEEVNKMYNDVNINLEEKDTKMTDALLANVQGTQVIEDTHVIITDVTPEVQQQSSSVSSGFISKMLNPNPDTGIDSILNPNIESTSLVDVLVTTNDESRSYDPGY
ncbi:hypothetical protein Tco_1031467 [Tanacetum coccineum]|uniref:Uncharacterized protein n=1 Tax=Tanacetum coccineum TaxID=301880 RepID=A0ABQ5G930_9ASTR